ncbi:putative RNA-binding protein [Neolecta irregularis DAH-3]|uniref:Putative RNA-binding protein n=1 Tax=Neolecta irregularis (strain DAH-3) TaxID=1198029 RepID=A0A1U7LM50_NEOID|nr:putative RNA-binding protein [Neolecta irregularis DAH-3]|eukprot:OLL23591.1 putative RNA-binding protein [Neolecta irregularis DAH-3]
METETKASTVTQISLPIASISAPSTAYISSCEVTSPATSTTDGPSTLMFNNLPYKVRWQDLKDLVRKQVEVIRADVAMNADNRSRGYGTVMVPSAEDAQKVIREFSPSNGTRFNWTEFFHRYEWQGRLLEVREAVFSPEGIIPPSFSLPPLPHTSPFPQSVYASLQQGLAANGLVANPAMGVGMAAQSQVLPISYGGARQVFIGNIPFSSQWQDLKDVLRQDGSRVLRVEINLDADGRSKGHGTALYATEQDAFNAINRFNGYKMEGRELRVRFDRFLHPLQAAATSTQPGMTPFFPFSSIHPGPAPLNYTPTPPMHWYPAMPNQPPVSPQHQQWSLHPQHLNYSPPQNMHVRR